MSAARLDGTDCVYILPATDPDDVSFGLPDRELAALDQVANSRVERIVFAEQVWYNAAVRAEVFKQIESCEEGLLSPRRHLVGFSKSGCGALNLLLDRPGFFVGALIFDAPFFNEDISRWGIGPFYESVEALYVDTAQGREAEWASLADTQLTLVAGEYFKADTERLARGLQALCLSCRVESSQSYAHRWDSGWLSRFWPVRTAR